jgi:hypothetical protein
VLTYILKTARIEESATANSVVVLTYILKFCII